MSALRRSASAGVVRRAIVAAAIASVFAAVDPVSAGDPPTPSAPTAAEQSAMDRYEASRVLYGKGELPQALVEIDASLKLMPSPNSSLLRAHILRELGRPAEAMPAYEEAVDGSVARIRAGEKRFEPTLAEAGRWVAMLRASLAELTVAVSGAPDGTRVVVGSNAATARPAPNGELDARVWHEPGTVTVTVLPPGGEPRTRSVDLAAGAGVRLLFELAKAAPPGQTTGPPPRAAPEGASGPPAASWIAGGVGVVGLAGFAIFGSMATGIENRLTDECGKNCTRAEQGPDADEGKRDQVLANIGLGVGVVGIAVAAVIWLAAPKRPPAQSLLAPARVRF